MAFERAVGPWVIKYRWWVIVGTLLVTALAASGIRFLTFNNDMRVFFSERNPQLKALDALENIYTRDDNALFIFAPKDGNVFTRRTLAAVEALTERAWHTPYSSRVDSITNFQHTRGTDDDLLVEDLIEDALNLSDAAIAARRRVALNEPLLLDRLISPSGHVTGVNVTIITKGESHGEVNEVTEFSRDLVADFAARYPDIDFYLAGGIIADTAFGEAGEEDARTLVPVMFLVLILLVGVLLRSISGTLATVLVILFAMLTGMGIAGWLGVELTAASVSAPVIILTLAVADSVHILEIVFQQMRLGVSKAAAISESLRVNLRAVLLTSVTTAIGFLSMNFSDVPPFRELGNIVATGVMAAFVYSIFFLPALIAVLPLRIAANPAEADCLPCNRWATLVTRRTAMVFWVTLTTSVVIAAGTFRNELNDNFLEYFDQSYDIRRASDFMQDNLTGFNIIEYSLESNESGGINDPAYLGTVEAFANWYREQPSVMHVASITDIVKRLNKNMNRDNEDYYRIPTDRQLSAQYLLLYEMSLPFGLDLNNRINVDKSATRLSVILDNVTTRQIRDIDERARAWLQANAPAEMFTYGTGLSVIWAHISARNIRNMLIASFGALILISILLAFALRSWKIGLLSLVPNLAPALMAFGLWGLIVGQVGLALSVVVSMTLGIVVDDTVHFLSRYLRARRERNMTPPQAIGRAFNTVGPAMWITTVALVAGFAVLALSHYKMSADMGLMSAMTIALALLLDFLLLPTLLLKVDR